MAGKYSLEQKLAAVRREIKYRERVYARLVYEGKMTQEKANEELAIFNEIAVDYDMLAAQHERLV